MRPQSGLRSPKNTRLGVDVAGQVEAVGAGVERVRPGDEVFGEVSESGWGSCGEYIAAPESWLELKPTNLSFEQAAAVTVAAATALQGLRDYGGLRAGQAVLIIGASGGVGTFAVQIAKWLGAEVTGVCSTRNLDLVRSLGAGRVIDYTAEDVTRRREHYDVVFQLAGAQPASRLRRIMTRQGTLVLANGDGGRLLGPAGRFLRGFALGRFVSQRVVAFVVQKSGDDLRLLRQLIEAGDVTPVIDRTYELREAAEAVRYLETGRARGKVIVSA